MSSITKRLRFEILRRDNHACRYCGVTAPEAKLVVDHVIPEVLGGTTDPSNLVTACEPCNSGKSSSSPDPQHVEDVKQDALRWSEAMHYAANFQHFQRELRNEFIEAFDEKWVGWHYGPDKQPIPRPSDWPNSIAKFRELGLTEGDLADLVESVMRNQRVDSQATWRYFCGACWTTLRNRMEIARGYLAAEDGDEA